MSSDGHGRQQPLCRESTTVHSWDNRDLISDAPALARLADGTLLCSVELWSRDSYRGADKLAAKLYGNDRCLIFASSDNGATWAERSRIPFATGKFLQHTSGLLFIGAGTGWQGLYIVRSKDGGKAWSDAVTLRGGKVYAAATGWTIRDNTLYWAADDMHPSPRKRAVFAFACDLARDPLDPTSWRFSNEERHPGLPQSLGRGGHNGGKWLEPNVVDVNGKLLVIVRVRASQAKVDGVVPGIGAICDLAARDGELKLTFSHYYPIPGAQNQFHIVSDRANGLFWMTSNQVTGTAQGCHGGWGKERRFLMLHYSRDAQNWFPAGVLAMWPKETQAYNYCTPLIDGKDLLFVSRTAESAANQHDNDKITFHRLPDFRRTAVKLAPNP
ncbi:MAG: exo-alpha-sialidase [Victivallales bacterium]|nr:exo-alpha-sialidase [Victivallales bacterium]